MNKQMLNSLWTMAWGMAMVFAMATKTKIDDNLVSAMGTQEMFDEFWEFLVEKGWVKGNNLVTKVVRKDLGLAEEKVA